VNKTQRSAYPRARRQPWFGFVFSVVAIALIFAGSFALSAFGDSRDGNDSSGARSAAGAEPDFPVRIELVNSSSVTVVLNPTNVRASEWGFPAPDSATPDGLRGVWLDPGAKVDVTLALSSWVSFASFDLSTLPIAGSSSGRAITFHDQENTLTIPGGDGIIMLRSPWVWPTAERPNSVTSSGCSPSWSGPAGSFSVRGGPTGSLLATATCLNSGSDGDLISTTTVITFTDVLS
jgi:hypothetical protein